VKALTLAAFASLLCVLTLAAILIGNGDMVVALLPALLVAVACAVCLLPLRYALLTLMFLALTMENPADVPAMGLWKSPLYPAGELLLAHLNLTFPAQKWLAFSGLDVVLVVLAALALARWLSGSRVDRATMPSARPMRTFAWVCLAGAGWMWAWGMVRGDADVASSFWQVQRVVYLPVVFLLFERSLRGPADREALGKVVVAAACIKAALAVYLHATLVPPAPLTHLDYATIHADSMLFSGAFCIVAALLIQGVTRRRALVAALVLPLLVAGMIANHRRVVWVELAAGLATVTALSPWTRTTRAIARAAVIAAPFVALYGAAGWGSESGIFAPVQTVRSVIDSKADASTEWRDLENYDIFFTLRQAPLLGTGYGHGYVEVVKLPAISQAYALYRFIPHNSILSLFAYGGVVGFFALWSMPVVGVFLAARAARYSRRSVDQATAIAACASIVVYEVHCYGDMGLGTWTSVFTVGPALAVAAQLAVATGAWPRRAAAAPEVPTIVVGVVPNAPPGSERRSQTGGAA
jgi:hypothetical protein